MNPSPVHSSFNDISRRSQSLSNDRCQNILYKAVFEHFNETTNIATLLLASKSFQNSSFGANFLVNFIVNEHSIDLLKSVLSPLSCFSLQFVPSLHIKQSWDDAEEVNRGISNFVGELVKTKYLHLSLQSLNLDYAISEVISFFFGSSSNSWPHLQHLTLRGREMNCSVPEKISQNALQIRTLNFSLNSRITDAGFEHIAKLSRVTSLNLYGTRIANAGLEHVGKLSNITSLDLAGCNKITDAGLEHISKLSNMISLKLLNCFEITDVGLDCVSKLSRITSLDLSFCGNITDAGLQHVSKLSRITDLILPLCTLITDGGLQHIGKLSNITSLDLGGCDMITAEAKQKLVTALPNCKIIDE